MRSTVLVPEEGCYVVAGLDGPPAEAAVRRVAGAMGKLLHAPVRCVHVDVGPGLRGEARRGALARVARGESEHIDGRPERVLAALAQAPGAVLTVLGVRQRPWRPGSRRTAGTAVGVARRVSRPLLLVPPSLDDWPGPTRVLSALDGTGRTALAAASALSAISAPDTVARSLHVADGPGLAGTWVGAGGADAAPARSNTRPIGRYVLQQAAEAASDLVVMVWSRQTRGAYAAAVLEVLSSSPVPVLLVPMPAPSAAA